MDTSTVSVVIKAALDYAYTQNPSIFFGVSRGNVEKAMQEALSKIIPTELSLTTNQPDFESIYLRLVQELQTDEAWYDVIPSSSGQTLLRNIAAGIAYALFAVERAQQETFLTTAYSDNSVFEAARMLGCRPKRRRPAVVRARLTRPDSGAGLTLPRFTQFEINKTRFFTRNNIVFNEFDLYLDVVLIQGIIITLEATAEGRPFERIEFGSESGLIADEDVYVFVDGTEWTRKIEEGPYNFGPNEECFYESTLPNKNVEIQFGNRAYGRIPPSGSDIIIRWAETEGPYANYSSTGLSVTLFEPPSGVIVEGTTLTAIQHGEEALDAAFYRVMAPHVRGSNQRAVRRADYREKALEYPGVVDAVFRGQAELNPTKRNWMNIIGATILMKDGNPMTSGEWDSFVAWMQQNFAIYQCEFLRMDPVVTTIDVSATIYCAQTSDLNAIREDIVYNVSNTFKPRFGALGYSIYQSDLADILEGTSKYSEVVSYCTDILPAGDTIVSPLGWVKINSVNLTMRYSTRENYMGRLDTTPVI